MRRYLAAQAFSILGDTSLWLAMAIWVRELTGSNAKSGLTFFFMAVPSLAGPLWGPLIDRHRRGPMLVGINIGGALMTLSLLFVHDEHQVWLIWTVMAGYGVINSLLAGTQSGFLRTLVPEALLGAAQGFRSTVKDGLRLIAPLIGAGLFTVAGGHTVAIIDAATFAVAALVIATIRIDEPRPQPTEQRWREEFTAGLAHIRRTVEIRQVVIANAVVCAVIGFGETALIAVVVDGLHRSPSWMGPFEAVMGVGALIGGPTVALAMRRVGEGRVCALGSIAFALGNVLLIFPTLGTVAAGAMLDGFGLPWLVAAALTLIQRRTPSGLQGRVMTAVDVAWDTPQSLSIAAGAGLIAVTGFQVLFATVAVVMAGAGVWLYTRPEQRLSTTAPELAPVGAILSLAPEPIEAAARMERQ
jgi:MFS family permease